VESECYLIRVANTGISGIITPWGESIVKTPVFKEAVFTNTIYY
jgi:apolipoprotein N-acyltransferase